MRVTKEEFTTDSPGILRYMGCKDDIVFLCGPAGTGKTRSSLEKMFFIAEKYAGSRQLITRSTRASLTESALVTWENEVVPKGHPILKPIQRTHRHSYIFPNKSEVIIAGLDNTQKVMSTQYDIIYIMEVIETQLQQIEDLLTRLRNDVVPYNQIIGDTNPWTPDHWVYQSYMKGTITMIDTTHEDNPVLYETAKYDKYNTELWPDISPDGRTGKWTEKGLKYIGKLNKLSGPKLQRLRYGKWTSAEGLVYEDFDPAKHICKLEKLPEEWPRYWSVDFGWNDPFVWQQWAVNDDIMYLEYEFYHTEILITDAIKEILFFLGWEKIDGDLVAISENPSPLPVSCICDWDAQGRATLTEETNLNWQPAYKSIMDGIQGVGKRLKIGRDGNPKMYFMSNSLIRLDKPLKEDMRPTCLLEEITGYIYTTKSKLDPLKSEKPIDKNNHSMDTMRYITCEIDGITGKDLKASEVPRVITDFESMVVVNRNSKEHLTRFGIFN